LVQVNKNQGSALSARIDYSSIIDKPTKTKPLSKDVKEDLKDLNDSSMFEGEI